MCTSIPVTTMPGISRALAYSSRDRVIGTPNLGVSMAGGDFLVAARRNVRVDPEGDRGAPVGLAGNAIDDLEFGVGFDIELEDVRGHRLADFALRLADPGKPRCARLESLPA